MDTSYRKLINFTYGIRFRLAVVYSTLFGVCLVFITVLLTGAYLNQARSDYDRALRNIAIDFSAVINRENDKVNLSVPKAEALKNFPFQLSQVFIFVRHLDGKILYTTTPHVKLEIPYLPELSHRSNYTHRFQSFVNPIDKKEYRGLNLKIGQDGDQAPIIIQVAVSLEGLKDLENRLVWFLFIIIPLSFLLAGVASTFVTGKALDPIRQLTKKINTMIESGNYHPLEVGNSRDEIERLAEIFNVLLQEMDKTLKAQEHFVANASHQLNTPLAIMKGELDVLLTKQRAPEEVNRFHSSLKEELSRMTGLVKNMLLVARVEAGKEHFTFAPVPLDEIITNTVSRLNNHAKAKNVSLKVNMHQSIIDQDRDLDILGEKQLLECMFENILENAIKYSSDHSSINILLVSDKDRISVKIKDQGPGFDQDFLDKVFEQRFSRGEKTKVVPGSGVGLHLVKKIADFHKATLSINNVLPNGAEVTAAFFWA